MNPSRIATFCVVSLCAACASHEGVFEPACIAYEGDRIELRDKHFVWQRFSDERRIDENGAVVNSFPDFPKTGSYELIDGRIELHADDGSGLGERYLHKQDGEFYLLSHEQFESVLAGGKLSNCALRLNAEES